MRRGSATEIAQYLLTDFTRKISRRPSLFEAANLEIWLQQVLSMDLPKCQFAEDPTRWLEFSFTMVSVKMSAWVFYYELG